jgi:hypothetical protein
MFKYTHDVFNSENVPKRKYITNVSNEKRDKRLLQLDITAMDCIVGRMENKCISIHIKPNEELIFLVQHPLYNL